MKKALSKFDQDPAVKAIFTSIAKNVATKIINAQRLVEKKPTSEDREKELRELSEKIAEQQFSGKERQDPAHFKQTHLRIYELCGAETETLVTKLLETEKVVS